MNAIERQMDELRELADRMDGLVPGTPEVLREAADTIGQLAESVTTMRPITATVDEVETIRCWVKDKECPSTEHVELIHVMECGACGRTYEHVNGDYEYCPHCRARIAEVDE